MRTPSTRSARLLVAGVVVAVAIGVAGPATARTTGKPAKVYMATTIKVKGTEYKFIGVPKTIKAGKHTFQFRDVGTESHMLALFKVKPGKTMDEALAYQGDPGSPDAPFTGLGAVSIDRPDKGMITALTAVLTPGDYAAACFATNAENQPHAMLGMVSPFTVVK